MKFGKQVKGAAGGVSAGTNGAGGEAQLRDKLQREAEMELKRRYAMKARRRLKSELAREIHNRMSSGINLNNLKVRVDEFNCMKDRIRNNLEVKCLNVTFELNDS